MPIYETEEVTVKDLYEKRKRNVCAVCGGMLNVFLDNNKESDHEGFAFLACNDWTRTHHDGIKRELNKSTSIRREIMEKQISPETSRALEKYQGILSLQKHQATEILQKCWPKAPAREIERASLLCATQQLNPLMGHVFLVPFNEGKQNESWATIIGIKAKRLMASRRGPYSYIDDTPRVMTEKEQTTIFGEIDKANLVTIIKLRDPKTGAEVVGYGKWPINKEPYGTDKGNSKFNMSSIRGESQALDRLRPGDMPHGFEVADENYINGDYKVLPDDETPPESKPEPPTEEVPPEQEPKVTTDMLHEAVVASPFTPPEPEPEKPIEEKPQPTADRSPNSILTIHELFKACHDDWKMQPKEVVTEAGYKYKEDITEKPYDIYLRIKEARG